MISLVLVDDREDAVVGLGVGAQLAGLFDRIRVEPAGSQARPFGEPSLPETLDLADAVAVAMLRHRGQVGVLLGQPAQGDQRLVGVAAVAGVDVGRCATRGDRHHPSTIELAQLGDEPVLFAFVQAGAADSVIGKLAAGHVAVGEVVRRILLVAHRTSDLPSPGKRWSP